MNAKFDVTEHLMVPDHQIMSADEVKDLLARYNISYEHLPKIYNDDPVMKAIGANTGDVISITRSSQTAGIAESYRLVIRKPKK